MSLLSAMLTLLHGFQIGFGLYPADLESEEGYLSFTSHMCRHTLQGSDELSERRNLEVERFSKNSCILERDDALLWHAIKLPPSAQDVELLI